MSEQNFRFYSYNMTIFGFSLWISLSTFLIVFGSFAHNNIKDLDELIIIVTSIAVTAIAFFISYSLSRYEVEVFVDAKQNCQIIRGKMMYILHNDKICFNVNQIKKLSYTSPGNSIFKRLRIELINKKKYVFHSDLFFGSGKSDQFVQYLENPKEKHSITITKKPELYSKVWYQLLVFLATIFGIYYLMVISTDDDYQFNTKTLIFITYLIGVIHQLFEIIEVMRNKN